jgi:hypothetical protein
MDSIASGYRPVEDSSEHSYGLSSSGSKCLYRLSELINCQYPRKDISLLKINETVINGILIGCIRLEFCAWFLDGRKYSFMDLYVVKPVACEMDLEPTRCCTEAKSACQLQLVGTSARISDCRLNQPSS